MTPDPHAESERLEALIGSWRTTGDVLGDDGETRVASVDGHDHYEWLGPFFVIHRIDVEMGGERVQGLEMIGPYRPEEEAFATRAYDDAGGEQTSTATVDADGVWTFGADSAEATLTLAQDGRTARADRVRTDDGGETWRRWMRLTLSRV
jgi:hypothetical protein